MEKKEIKGIIARDNTGWQSDFETDIDSGCGVMWKHQISDFDKIKDQLQVLISKQKYFDYYNIANNYSNYHCKIVDFATIDDYQKKYEDWQKREPVWLKESFDDYRDKNKKAKIVFLVEDFKKIPHNEQIECSQFVTFNNTQATVQNAVAYTDIKQGTMVTMTTKIISLMELLRSNKNLILTGAPGTGKTYLAKQIAAQMICRKPYETELENDDTFQAQCKFVQFHPSFDYTDFVEGLRPMPQNERSSDIKFVRQNGIFKDFCKDAILRRDKDLDMAFNQFVADIKARKITTIPLKTKESAKLIVKEEGNIRWYSEKEVNNISSNAVSKERLLKLYTRYSTLEELDSISNQDLINVIGGCDPTYFWGTLHYLLENYMNYPYIFIIDEINRGEISKIFGELFFCIESGYRGIKGRVQTQYQNLVEPTDTFADGFYIPENVFIIGTMNDIDRSVECLDFAMRRRFAFEEIQASDTIEMIKSNDNLREFYQDIEKRMKNLNLCILTIQGFSSAYQIGAAYFLKLANYLEGNKLTEKSWENLWNNHLHGLLFEYLRGVLNADEDLQKLYRAYLLKDTYKLEDGKVVKDE